MIDDRGVKEMLGIKSPTSNSRGSMDMGDICKQRSDRVPGIFTCIECNRPMALQESWRAPVNPGMGGFSTLFCAPCAMRVNECANLNLSPINLNAFDRLNTGEFVAELGTVQPAAPAAPAARSKWDKLLKS